MFTLASTYIKRAAAVQSLVNTAVCVVTIDVIKWMIFRCLKLSKLRCKTYLSGVKENNISKKEKQNTREQIEPFIVAS